jgi:hypothetical protein
MENQKSSVFKNKIQRRIFESKRVEETGGW